MILIANNDLTPQPLSEAAEVTSKSQNRRSLASEAFLDGLKSSNGLDVVWNLLTAVAVVVVVAKGLLLVVGVVTSAVVLEGVT